MDVSVIGQNLEAAKDLVPESLSASPMASRPLRAQHWSLLRCVHTGWKEVVFYSKDHTFSIVLGQLF